MLTYYFHCIPDNAALNPQSEIYDYGNITMCILRNNYFISWEHGHKCMFDDTNKTLLPMNFVKLL